jgi:hypothetical protein
LIGRHKSADRGGEEAEGQGEEEDAVVQLWIEVRVDEGEQRLRDEWRDGDAEQRATERDDGAFAEHLPGDSAARGAQGEARGEFGHTRCATSEGEACHVDAGEQEEQ